VVHVKLHEDWLTRVFDALFVGPNGVRYFDAAAWDWMFAAAIAITGFALAMARSTWVVDFTVYVFVFNRGFRRFVDYYFHHEFNPLSPISLTPLLVAGVMLIPAILRLHQLTLAARIVFLGTLLAMLYAFAVGFLNSAYAAFYSLAESLAPLGLFAFVCLTRPAVPVRDRWVRSFAWAAILTSAYGWYQYLNVPPWDAFWLIETEMYGYMGMPAPTEMTVFSTMAERGPLAGYLGFSVIPMVVSRRWRPLPGPWGWLGVILVFSVILLTLSRSGVLFAVIGTSSYLFINGGQGARQFAVAAAVLGMAAWWGVEKIPNSERVVKRFETLGELQEDGSYKGRIEIMSGGFNSLATRPWGYGLGSVGLGGRVNSGEQDSRAIIVDAGWFNLLLVYGLPGSVCLVAAMGYAWQDLGRRFRASPLRRDPYVCLARGYLVALVPCMFVGDLLTGFSILWLALGCGISAPRGNG
jgi:hypothetical protein